MSTLSAGTELTTWRCKRFRLVGVGGTFDIIHKGHETLLRKALEIGEKVQIGVTTDPFVRRMKKPHKVQPYSVRVEEVRRFLQMENALERTEVVPIDDEYGTATTNPDMEALVVSKEKLHVAMKINRVRQSSGLTPLKLIEVDMVLAEDQRPISASRIRRKEITRSGKVLGSQP
jgi:pantetheine-phosphate adenylyltransferase